MSLISELKRRKVFRVAAGYLVVAWLVVQAASIGFPAFDAPPWALRVFILLAFMGFPIALVLAWVFDVTPEGLKVDASRVGTKRLVTVAAALAALALGWYFYGQPAFRKGDAVAPKSAATPAAPAAPAVSAVDPNSIAVLPFVNMSGEADQEYFSDGMTEELLNVLARMPNLKVTARTSVFEFKGKGGDVREIGRKLGVAHIVEGSVRRDGQEIRVTAQMVRVADGFHVWSETYDRKLEGVFALQDDIARRIGQQLQSSLGGATPTTARAEIPPAVSRAEIPPEAYEEYLKGRALYRQRKQLPQAIAHFEAAVAQAPQFAAGWGSLSLTYEVIQGYITPDERARLGDTLAKCRVASQHAYALDPDSAMTLHAVADVARDELRFADAERLYLRSMQADPTYADVREDYAEMLGYVGRDADAAAAARQLVAMEPFVRVFWSQLLYAAQRLDQRAVVEDAASRIRVIDPGYYDGIAAEFNLELYWGRIDEARAALSAASKRNPEVMADDVVLFAWATHAPGADEAAVQRTIARANDANVVAYALVRGDADLAFKYFRDNPVARYWRMQFYEELAAVPGRPLLADPRSKTLLREYGFEAYWREKGWPALCRPLGADDFECGPAGSKN
jgi:TolB-like protein